MRIQSLLLSLFISCFFFSCENTTTKGTTTVNNTTTPITKTTPNVKKPVVDKTLLLKEWKVTLWESVDLLDIMGDDYEAYKAKQMKTVYNFTESEKGTVTIDGKTVDCLWNLSNNSRAFKMKIGEEKVKYMDVKSVSATLLKFEWTEEFTWKKNPLRSVKIMMQIEEK